MTASTSWPFTVAELTAGLRRYFAEPGLRIKNLTPCQAQQRDVCGMRVTYETRGETLAVDCVVKEPRGAARPGLAHPGVREAGVYRSLASQLPMATPALIAADAAGRWLVLEAVDAAAGGPWNAAQARQAAVALAGLHERFWDLADDLSAYPWLARPLTLDYQIHVYAAAQALGQIVRDEHPASIAHSAAAVRTVGQLISQADEVVGPLRALPFTLLHGDFWEGNLLRDEDDELIVLDWQMAAIGPGVLDVVTMVTTRCWQQPDAGVGEQAAGLAAAYRAEIDRCLGVRWPDAEWDALWDRALLWRFLQEMLVWAASAPRDVFAARADDFEAIWIQPVLAAARRRLTPDEHSGWPALARDG